MKDKTHRNLYLAVKHTKDKEKIQVVSVQVQEMFGKGSKYYGLKRVEVSMSKSELT